MIKSKSIRVLIGLLITALAIWLSFKNLDWKALQKSISNINFIWVILAVLNVFLTVYAMGWRWRVLLKSRLDISMGYMFQLNIISQYLNIIIPGRFGELAKAWLPAKRHGESGSYILGTVIIEKMFDFFGFVILWISVPVFQVKGYTLSMTILLVVILVLLIWKREILRSLLLRFSKILPGKIKVRVVSFFERGMDGFSQLKQSGNIAIMIFYTVLIFLLSTLTNFLLFLAFGFELSIFQALVLLLVIWIGSTPPSVPGRVGVFEYAVLLGLALFSIDKSEAMSYALILHMVSYLPKIILGSIFMANMKISIKNAEHQISKNNKESAKI
jgi:glycosyltransferase 2 family protein